MHQHDQSRIQTGGIADISQPKSTGSEHANVSEDQLSRVAIKLFFEIASEWSLCEDQRVVLIGLASRTTLHNWRVKLEKGDNIKLSRDTLERLSYIAGIYKGIQILFAQPEQWKNWIHKPNELLGGQSAMERMLAGSILDLAHVRHILDAWRGEQYV